MAGALRKTMLFLGLADEPGEGEMYDEFDEVVEDATDDYQAQVTPLHRSLSGPDHQRLRPASDLRRITTVHPRSYNDARVIGEAFRGGTPVIMNLSDMDDADAKRLVDFSAGLIFGLCGSIERVTNKVFLLSPEHVEVTGEDTAQPAAPPATFFNQS